MEIQNKIVKTELVEWQKIKWFQSNDLKELNKERMEKLKRSLVENGFAMPFHVWEKENGELYFLDGHHREKAMQELLNKGFNGETVNIPDKLPATFMVCEDEKEAANLLLVYSSIYAKISQDGIEEFIKINELDLSVIEDTIELPDIVIDRSALMEIVDSGNEDNCESYTNAISSDKTAVYIWNAYGIISKDLAEKFIKKYNFTDDENKNGEIFTKIFKKIIGE